MKRLGSGFKLGPGSGSKLGQISESGSHNIWILIQRCTICTSTGTLHITLKQNILQCHCQRVGSCNSSYV